jgi:hypothetical protein
MSRKTKRDQVEEEPETESEQSTQEEESPKPKPKRKAPKAKEKAKNENSNKSLEEIGKQILKDARKIKRSEKGKLNYTEAVGLSSLYYKANKNNKKK